MSEKKMHYFEFHFQKFIAATKGWKDDEVGAFLKLLIEQFDRGYIPNDPEELSRLITTYKKNWSRLAKKFTAPAEQGQLKNTFMATVREQAHEKSVKNAASGSKGGRAKKANAIANGTPNAKRTSSERGSQPVTSNQEPVNTDPEEGKSVMVTRPELLESNLFRQPKIPNLETVQRVFLQQGGTAEMAQKFFDANEATGWFWKGSPIMNFSNLVPGYIGNWARNESGSNGEPQKKTMVV